MAKNNKAAFFEQIAEAVQGGENSTTIEISQNKELTERERAKKFFDEIDPSPTKNGYTPGVWQPDKDLENEAKKQNQKKGFKKNVDTPTGAIQIGSVAIVLDQLDELNEKMLEINEKKCNVRIHPQHDHALSLLAQNLRYEHNLAKSAISKTSLVYLILEAALKDLQK